MHRDSRRVLRFIRKSDLFKGGSCLFVDFYDACSATTRLTDHQIMAIIRQLEFDGYIRFCQDNFGNSVGFELEHRLYCFRYYRWVSVRSFLVNSILVPLIVAAITAYVTLLITGK